MEVADIPAITKAAHEAGAYVVVDNTFATPLLQQPLDWDVDLVVHSATKYIGGHADLLMGAIVTRDEELFAVLKGRRDLVGAIPGAFEAWLALRGLRTLPLRMEKAQANAHELVRRLRERGDVTEVRYPGFGGIIGLVLPTADIADFVQHSTKLWVYATSLGGVESSLERRRRWKSEAGHHPRGPDPPLGRHRGRRGPLGRPQPGARRRHPLTSIVSAARAKCLSSGDSLRQRRA